MHAILLLSPELARILLETGKYVGSFVAGAIAGGYYVINAWSTVRKLKMDEQRFEQEQNDREAAREEREQKKARVILEPTPDEVLKYAKQHLFASAPKTWIPVVVWLLLMLGLNTTLGPSTR